MNINMNMIKKLFRHPDDINDPLTGMEIAGMTFAGASGTVVQVMISVFMVYYYTNVAGISAAVVGTLMLITRVADGFFGIGAGMAISKTRSRFGQARPWALRLAVPILLAVIMAFSVPERWDITAKTVYACITFFLLNVVILTPAGIAGATLGTNMTVNPGSRRKSATLSSLFVMIGSVVGNVAVLQITQAGGDSYEAWRLTAVIFGALAFAGQAAQFLLTRERISVTGAAQSPENNGKKVTGMTISGTKNRNSKIMDVKDISAEENKRVVAGQTPMKTHASALLRNKYFVIMCLVGLTTALDGATAGCIVYYVKYVLGNMDLMGIISAVTLLSMMAGIMLTSAAARKAPAKMIILAGLAIKITTLAINLLYPANLALFIGFNALRSLTGAPLMVYSGIYLLNTIEYGEYKTGIRSNHLIVSVSGIWSKIGAGLGGAMTGWMLSYSGYNGAAEVQTAAAQNTIVAAYFLVPLVTAVATLILIYIYDLDKNYASVLAALNERKTADKTVGHDLSDTRKNDGTAATCSLSA